MITQASSELEYCFSHPESCLVDPTLKTAQCVKNWWGGPVAIDGQESKVFKMLLSGSNVALKCFHTSTPDRGLRYHAIAQYFKSLTDLRCPIPSYHEQALLYGSTTCPAALMNWIDGSLLVDAIQARLASPQSIDELADWWRDLEEWMETNNVSHGDLDPSNIIVLADRINLIDLDTVYVPSLSGCAKLETMDPLFRHPSDLDPILYPEMHRFASWLIYLNLIGIAFLPELATEFSVSSKLPINTASLDKWLGIFKSSTIPKLMQAADLLGQNLNCPPNELPSLSGLVQTPQKTSLIKKLVPWWGGPTSNLEDPIFEDKNVPPAPEQKQKQYQRTADQVPQSDPLSGSFSSSAANTPTVNIPPATSYGWTLVAGRALVVAVFALALSVLLRPPHVPDWRLVVFPSEASLLVLLLVMLRVLYQFSPIVRSHALIAQQELNALNNLDQLANQSITELEKQEQKDAPQRAKYAQQKRELIDKLEGHRRTYASSSQRIKETLNNEKTAFIAAREALSEQRQTALALINQAPINDLEQQIKLLVAEQEKELEIILQREQQFHIKSHLAACPIVLGIQGLSEYHVQRLQEQGLRSAADISPAKVNSVTKLAGSAKAAILTWSRQMETDARQTAPTLVSLAARSSHRHTPIIDKLRQQKSHLEMQIKEAHNLYDLAVNRLDQLEAESLNPLDADLKRAQDSWSTISTQIEQDLKSLSDNFNNAQSTSESRGQAIYANLQQQKKVLSDARQMSKTLRSVSFPAYLTQVNFFYKPKPPRKKTTKRSP